MKWAILGGGGSFAIHCAFWLLHNANPDKVIGIGRNYLRKGAFSIGIENESNFEYHARHITYELDLLLELLDKERPEILVNFAAQGEGAVSWQNSWRFFETNCVGLSHLVEELMKRNYVKRFIHIGTSELYGSCDEPMTEDMPIRPSSPYGISKAAFDLYLISMHRFRNFPMTILRPGNAYGPGQLLHRVIPKTVWCGLKGKKLPLHGSGAPVKSWIHSRDLARAIHLVAGPEHIGKVYNVGAIQPTSVRSVVEMIADKLGLRFDDLCDLVPDRLGQDKAYRLDSSAIKNAVGWEPLVDWSHGLDDMINWANHYWPELQNASTEYVFRA